MSVSIEKETCSVVPLLAWDWMEVGGCLGYTLWRWWEDLSSRVHGYQVFFDVQYFGLT